MNPLLALSHDIIAVTVEFDGPKGRERKEFRGKTCVSASRRLFAAKLKDGKNPRIVASKRRGDV